MRSIRRTITSLLAAAFIALQPLPLLAQTGPSGGSVDVQGQVDGKAPTILTPEDGAEFEKNPVRVAGTCVDGLLIAVFRNGIFGGSDMCTDGAFSVETSLFKGENDVAAVAYDALDKPSADSNHITLTLNGEEGLLLTSEFSKRGVDPGDPLTWPIVIEGGEEPYAVGVDWGDAQDDVVSVEEAGNFDITHTYDQSGTFTIQLEAADADGNEGQLQLVAVANGPVRQDGATTGRTIDSSDTTTQLMWGAAAGVPLLILGFWLGKRYEFRRINKNFGGSNTFGQ